jgi:hypothetical protein
MLTTEETRELGASVMAYLSPPKDTPSFICQEDACKEVFGEKLLIH